MKKILLPCLIFFSLYSCDDVIEVPDISGRTVNILAPTENAELSAGNIRFTWQEVNDANQYNIQIATPNFATATQILTDTLLPNRNFSKTLSPGNYQWRVKALNSNFMTTYSTVSFTLVE